MYQVLSDNQLCQYYDLNRQPGTQTSAAPISRFAFLDLPDIERQLSDFQNETLTTITFYVPTIHCSSCLWLLEHLYRISPAIRQSRVDFLKKQVTLTFAQADLSLRQVVELLTSLGYEPLIGLNDVVKKTQTTDSRALLYRLAVAGFCAGNIMLFSFPEYLGLDDPAFKYWFGIINLVLATPVVFYSGSGYFESVWRSLRRGIINIDFPILLGILMAYGRGTYEVVLLDGAGYFDSVSGLIFFLLCGKWFQQRTYDFLSFERDYKAYFPLAVTQLTANSEQLSVPAGNRNSEHRTAGGENSPLFTDNCSLFTEKPVPVGDLRTGDRIRIRHGELIPADGILFWGSGLIDYSFVTGESEPERRNAGALVYAGGRQMGEAIDLEVVRETSQSYLTQLWNNDAFRKSNASNFATFADYVGKYFTITVLTLATLTGLYWFGYRGEVGTAVNAFTAVLIVACPCVLSLSYPVALGHGLRLLGKRKFYLKNADVIEQMAACDTVVFDKTGTLTKVNERKGELVNERMLGGQSSEVSFDYQGVLEDFEPVLADFERAMVLSVVQQSAHPLSRRLTTYLGDAHPLLMEGFTEVAGQGVQAVVDGWVVKLGRKTFVGAAATQTTGTAVHLSIEGQYRGYFPFPNPIRPGVDAMLTALQKTHALYLLSGDTDATRTDFTRWFGPDRMTFGCSPQQKLDVVRQLQADGHRVLMIGDGLNDAGALKQANVGIAVTDDAIQFTPASDGILEGQLLAELPGFLRFSRFGMRLIRFSFGVSLLYNVVGLSYALTAHLSPIVAAILMPLSSTTMVLIATVGMRWRKVEG